MSRYLLDTHAISALLRDPAGAIAARLRSVGEGAVCTSVIVAAELRYGCAKRPGTRLATRVEAFLDEIPVLAFDRPADRAYGTLRASLEHAGAVIGRNDLLIAAHALALDATVVTANVREFGRVDGLRVENWAEVGAMPSAIT